MGKHWDHTLVSLKILALHLLNTVIERHLVIKMMYLVAFVQDVRHQFWWRRVDDCRRYHIRHVSMILIFGQFQLWVRVKLADGCKMYIAPVKVSSRIANEGSLTLPKYCHPDRLLSC